LVDRNLVMSVGGFDPQLSQCADWDLWIRLLATTDFAYVETPLVRYRVHESNMSRNVNLLETDSERVLTKVFSTQNLPKETCRRRRSSFARNAMVLAGSYYHAKCYRDAARCLGRSLALDFRQASYLAAYPKRILYRWFGLCKS
jgi:hypothetical protein